MPGLTVELERVVHLPELEAPWRDLTFAHFIRIINESVETISILGRKWILRDDTGQVFVVEGRGVVGQFRCSSRERFFHTYHVVAGDSMAASFGLGQDGVGIRVRIPEFELKIPRMM